MDRLDAEGLGGARGQQRAWLSLTLPLGIVENTALLAAPHEMAREYLENHLRQVLDGALSAELGRDIRVAITVSEHQGPSTTTGPIDRGALAVASSAPVESTPAPPMPEAGLETSRLEGPSGPRDATVVSIGRGAASASRLNPKYTFDTFVIGSSNRFSHAAAVAVAEAPARAYNPLFIYGESGLGKTHLLHAIGEYGQRLLPALRTRYVSSEEFTNDFINSLRDDKMQAFQARYRSVDLLLIDDIQFLERAERTQEEFFHTFNTLHNANKQIVISSDRPPRQLSTLEDRLRTRFEWGLITDVQAPDLETRIAILRKKAATEGMDPPPDVLEFIATRIQSNIRELEGALIRVIAFASLSKQRVDIGLTETVLKDLISAHDSPAITVATIMAVCAEYYSVSMDDLTGGSRSRVLVEARQIAMYLCRELTELSLPKIGQTFGGRDHTTVLHAERKIRQVMSERLTVYNQISELTARIKSRGRD
ncbi:chromosomal replication initiator protein DnaA [Jatrophihabitans sp. YIM 134969]